MNTDRELLMLAAKAAGYIDFTWGEVAGPRARKPNGVAGPWNPLIDDGDALRLAVKLDISLSLVSGAKSVMTDSAAGTLWEEGADIESVRRAIVTAAAEIGKTKNNTLN